MLQRQLPHTSHPAKLGVLPGFSLALPFPNILRKHPSPDQFTPQS